MSDDVKNDLRGMAETGKVRLPRDIVDKFNEPQAALMITVSDMRGDFNRLFDKVFDRLDGFGQDISQIKKKQAETNGHVGEALAKTGEALARLAFVEKMEADRRTIETAQVNFRKGIIFIPALVFRILGDRVTWSFFTAFGIWALHHFQFIP